MIIMTIRLQQIFGLTAAFFLSTTASPAEDKPDKKQTPPKPGIIYPTLGTVERLDPKLDQLIPADAKIEKLGEGYSWAEGPVWVKQGGYLLFSDVPRNTVFKWKEGDGVSTYIVGSGYSGTTPRGGEPGSNGLTVDAAGRLCLCEHGNRRVSRMNPPGFETLAEFYQFRRFNSPNDLVFKSNGDLYFTDPPYGLEGQNADPKKELPFNAVFRVNRKGEVTLLTTKLTYPNGIAFSPDEKILYVANSDPKWAVWMAFDVKPDGTLGEGRVFFDATEAAKVNKPGLPDGLKTDRAGNLFATGPGGVFVISPEGVHLGTISTGEAIANCGWGDDGSTLYLTANHWLCRIKTSTKGKIP